MSVPKAPDNQPHVDLVQYGWNDFFARAFAEASAGESAQPARVTSAHRGGVELITAGGPKLGMWSGKLHLRSQNRRSVPVRRPVVGDWVVATLRPGDETATVHSVLERRTTFQRRAPAHRGDPIQVIAANIDVVLVVTALDRDFNIPRLERYLTLIGDGGAQAGIVLNKADACDNSTPFVQQTQALLSPERVHLVSAKRGQGLDALRPYFSPHQTVALLGSSGVGKSTLTNALCSDAGQEVQKLRSKMEKGRHTTTVRQMFVVPGGGLLVDTPGLRELQLLEEDDAGTRDTFDDVAGFADRCRFADCTHDAGVPGCAVQEALAEGNLEPRRVAVFQQRQSEQRVPHWRREGKRRR